MVIRTKRPTWTDEKSEKQWRSSLETYAFPILDKKPLAEITIGDALEVLEPKWNELTETLWRVRQRMRNGWQINENRHAFRRHLKN